jgi:integrase
MPEFSVPEFEDYLVEMQAQDRAPGTIDQYKVAFRRFETFARETGVPLDMAEWNRNTINQWKVWLGSRTAGHRKWSKQTQSIWTRAFMAFLRWCKRQQIITWEPPEAVPVQRGERPALTMDQVEIVMHGVVRGGAKNACRNEALVLLMLGTGLRPGEVSQLEVSDLDLEDGWLHVRPEISKVRDLGERTLKLTPNMRSSLANYLRTARAAEHSQSGALFLNERGQPLQLRAIQMYLKRLAGREGLPRLFPRMFRHTWATQALLHGHELPMIQDQLGHKRLSTTEGYLNHTLIQKARLKSGWSPAEDIKY